MFELECWLELSELDGNAHDDAPPLKEIVHLERSQSAVMLEQASATRLPRDCHESVQRDCHEIATSQCNEIATTAPFVPSLHLMGPDCT